VCLNGLDVKGDNIPSNHHIARLCRKGIDGDQILGAAFLPRPQEDYLSVNWLERLKCQDRPSEITEIRKRYAENFKLNKKYKIALLNVGVTCSKVAERSDNHRCLKATHEPEPTDDSHSGLWGFSDSDILIAEWIRSTVLEDFPAIDTP
jgi:hypothetical protein